VSIKDWQGGIVQKTATEPSGPWKSGGASGMWTLDEALKYKKQGKWPLSDGPSPGQQQYTSAGTYSWTAPTGVTSVSVVVVGSGAGGDSGGGAGGGGGALGWKNNITVVPGSSYTVKVGAAGPNSGTYNGNESYFIDATTVQAGGGKRSGTNSYVGDGGGDSSGPYGGGGGGAGGYSGAGSSGTGGCGGRGTTSGLTGGGAGGGGVGLLGEGSSGANGGSNAVYGATMPGGGGGSGGSSGSSATNSTYNGSYSAQSGGSGGNYGGGAGAGFGASAGSSTGGAVRIIWGPNRAFPSTNTGNV